jgi:hypothetical protein
VSGHRRCGPGVGVIPISAIQRLRRRRSPRRANQRPTAHRHPPRARSVTVGDRQPGRGGAGGR